ncbi:MAG TPA: PQQ-dependent sugar dehydrogenase, partial [Fodinibius sp.]|nr:PQQ-dependent sugar dehydrogenase [Fodinibius sp.]
MADTIGEGPQHLIEKVAQKKGWSIREQKTRDMIQEDSLAEISSIVLPSSQLNQVNYRSLNALKRYLEAGGGFILVKDEPIDQSGRPWLQKWNRKELGKKLSQDRGRLYLLSPDASQQRWDEGLKYVAGEHADIDYKRVQTPAVPDSSRYTREVLTQGLNEPMQMAVLPNQNVLFVERKGGVKLYDSKQKELKSIAHFDVYHGIEDGLLGTALDPEYDQNHWVYFYYAAPDTMANRLSRMKLQSGQLDKSSEQVLLEIPTQRTYCCHSAGYLRFGPAGALYLSVGDNTNADDPYKVGYPPVDERPGHELADDQATAANTMDLRGKILRIIPQPGGGYEIPEGNLYPKGTPKTRPEIFVMGLRNPFRFTVDQKTGILYWGEVGPNTKVRGRDGTKMSYDELNRAAQPGFYGWPYFLGPNDAYPMYDFGTGEEGPRKDPTHPINDSPNNTGLQALPPAQPAMIWYGPESSQHFPLVGSGGASLMAGPVYYIDQFPDSSYKLSSYYDGKLFIYEWIRNWIMAVTLDEEGKYVRMEPFLGHMEFASPMDMQFGPEGGLYLLEYGSNWFSKNQNAKLVRITYTEGNRDPIADIQTDKTYGAAPLTINFSATESRDYDKDDELQYEWNIEGQTVTGKEISHTFESRGEHPVLLTVKDGQGGQDTTGTTISVGNSSP